MPIDDMLEKLHAVSAEYVDSNQPGVNNWKSGLPFSATTTSAAKYSPTKVVVRSRIELYKTHTTPLNLSTIHIQSP